MTARIYSVPVSHPSAAARAMLRHKRIPYRHVRLMTGLHPLLVRLAGFGRHTVPALELDGRKVQGSRAIARHLDRVRPDPRLYPAEPERRAAVEESELWGELAFQPVPRRLFRYVLATSEDARLWVATDVLHMPAPRLMAALFMPVIRHLADISHGNEPKVREALAELPGQLDEVDRLIAAGTIGGEQPNAADFQILSTVRALLEFEELAPLMEGRASVPLARRLYPRWPGPAPRGLPPL